MTIAFMNVQSNPTREANPRRGALGRALPTLAALFFIALFLAAASWQHARMREKDALRAAWDEAGRAEPVALPPSGADWAAWRYRRVRLEGHYDAARQIFIDNRVDAGRVGYHVVTPLALADGRAVLVDRGFVAGGPSRAALPAVPVPPGEMVVRGRVELPGRYVELADAAPQGALWQNLDPARFSAATGLDVLPVVVQQDAGDAQDGLARNWPAPDFGRERHLSYMLQWLAFAATVLGLWIWFVPLQARRAARSGDTR